MTNFVLQEDNGSFASWTNIASTSKRVYSVDVSSSTITNTFTPTDGRHYRLVASSTLASTTYSIFNAKIIATQTSIITIFEPQYLLANTTLTSGTSLQNALTKWDSAEWTNASTTFQHQLDAADNSASDGEVDTSGGTLVTGSTVTNPDNVGTSTEMTMPSNGNLDMKLTTNNGDVYASRILVRVDLDPPVGGGGGESTPAYIQSEFWFE
jgi:hypothetical protein